MRARAVHSITWEVPASWSEFCWQQVDQKDFCYCGVSHFITTSTGSNTIIKLPSFINCQTYRVSQKKCLLHCFLLPRCKFYLWNYMEIMETEIISAKKDILDLVWNVIYIYFKIRIHRQNTLTNICKWSTADVLCLGKT